METQWLAKLRRIFRYRIAFGRIIPPNARANPAQFSEAEFPIVCPKCDYLLRGLTVPRCPECGRDFDRGRLLVEQYVIEGGLGRKGRVSKFAKWCMYFTAIVIFAMFGVGFLLWFLLPPPSEVLSATQAERIGAFLMPVTICLMVTLPVSVAVVIRRMILRFRNRKKARRVLESCKHDAPDDTMDR
ncbi:MAG: hypothetical protein IIC01_08985 [Planctomycetes bacterium]|nr:hypothetical protein [Planctomycetota bacterium]